MLDQAFQGIAIERENSSITLHPIVGTFQSGALFPGARPIDFRNCCCDATNWR
jgi:hypothetical protein